jgi:hypothetical protein
MALFNGALMNVLATVSITVEEVEFFFVDLHMEEALGIDPN